MNSSGLYIADTGNCRVIEIAASSGTQWGISMTAGDMYVIAGRTGQCALGNDAKVATQSDLDDPVSLHLGAGTHGSDLYIADAGNNRIQEIAATTETEWGQSMTATFVYTVAGSSAGTSGQSTTAARRRALASPTRRASPSTATATCTSPTRATAASQEVPVSTGTYCGTSMTQIDLYTVAGRNGGTNCTIGFDNKAANPVEPVDRRPRYATRTATCTSPTAATTGSRRSPAPTHTEFGQSMTADYVYTVAGSLGDTGRLRRWRRWPPRR